MQCWEYRSTKNILHLKLKFYQTFQIVSGSPRLEGSKGINRLSDHSQGYPTGKPQPTPQSHCQEEQREGWRASEERTKVVWAQDPCLVSHNAPLSFSVGLGHSNQTMEAFVRLCASSQRQSSHGDANLRKKKTTFLLICGSKPVTHTHTHICKQLQALV